ncbi:hypothetical protein OC842_005874 [Tilletia horrida]|uniref:Acetyl-CoA carboxylase n=1 Tax=Tilletia horrida TaxID=155126 RepID=A0AAN6G701_9BASI|nr:hypothetical protein OC842_005874 [Tilletia horrida]
MIAITPSEPKKRHSMNVVDAHARAAHPSAAHGAMLGVRVSSFAVPVPRQRRPPSQRSSSTVSSGPSTPALTDAPIPSTRGVHVPGSARAHRLPQTRPRSDAGAPLSQRRDLPKGQRFPRSGSAFKNLPPSRRSTITSTLLIPRRAPTDALDDDMARPDAGLFRVAALPLPFAGQQNEPKELRLFIANRGEIALRILATVSATAFPGHRIVPIVPHTRSESRTAAVLAVSPPQRVLLPQEGPAAFLDGQGLIAAAKGANAHAVIPGYGFLSESADFAQAVIDAGLIWIGPDPAHLRTFGDKLATRQLAAKTGIPIVPAAGEAAPLDLAALQSFAQSLPNRSKVILKAVAGGGGRGMRVIDVEAQSAEEVRDTFESCAREAAAAFGNGALFAELLVDQPRHIEVQVVGDGTGAVAHLWERECTLQRRHQKLVEWAPSPTLRPSSDLRSRLLDAALQLAGAVKYKSVGTFEFLVLPDTDELFFMEANPRIQVEHTVTEQVTGHDIVALQLRIALGESLADVGLGSSAPSLPFPQRFAVQLRINAEQIASTGEVLPSAGALTVFSPPTGRNVRIETAAHAPRTDDATMFTSSPAFDSLLAKLIVTGADFPSTLGSARGALESFSIGGIATNREFLLALLNHADVKANDVHTRFIDLNVAAILASAPAAPEGPSSPHGERRAAKTPSASAVSEPLSASSASASLPVGAEAIIAPLAATVVSVDVKVGDAVRTGQQVAVLSAMKMENLVRASAPGIVEAVLVKAGDSLERGRPILHIKTRSVEDVSGQAEQDAPASGTLTEVVQEEVASIDPGAERAEVSRLRAAKEIIHDGGRSAAVAKRHRQGFLTARENIALLVDKESFVELGDFVVAAQRSEVEMDQLKAATPGDGVLIGWATINEKLLRGEGAQPRFPSPARVALCIGDYMTQAGTQGWFHHLKLDRIFGLVLQNPAPLVLYAEGGGGRPNDFDLMHTKTASLDTPSFTLLSFIKVRGFPTIGVGHQFVFAGNAALYGTCDITIATKGSSIGMGGPAMIEGGGLGKVAANAVGPAEMHAERGHIDILVENEREAAEMAKRVLLFFQGPLPVSLASSRCTTDQRLLRHVLPKSRTRTYDVRRIITTLADDGSFVELGERHRTSLITGFMHIEGQPVAVIASDVSTNMGGAIDVSAALKTTRFLQMLTRTRAAHLLVLCDTPGFAIGPEEEVRGGVRAFSDLFGAYAGFLDGEHGGRIFGIVVRKGYGLAAEAIMGGATHSPLFCAAWPMAEMAGMNIEGAVALGMRKQLAAIEDAGERKELFDSLVAEMYERGKAESMAAKLEVDTVIDPADTRKWLLAGLRSVPARIPTWQSARASGRPAHL